MMVMELPKRKNIRLPDYNYATPGAYFVTICTYNRKKLFWNESVTVPNANNLLPLSKFGKIVDECIVQIPNIYPAYSVDHYVVMPNHVHLLVQIQTAPDGRQIAAPTLNSVIGHMKRAVSMRAGFSLWQKGFYDHVIRSESDYLDAWNYIDGNPQKWRDDDLYIPFKEEPL